MTPEQELEKLIREQAREMKYPGYQPPQKDTVRMGELGRVLSNQGFVSSGQKFLLRTRSENQGCAIHGKTGMRLIPCGQVYCAPCKRIATAKWKEKNHDHWVAWKREWRRNNPEKIAAQQRRAKEALAADPEKAERVKKQKREARRRRYHSDEAFRQRELARAKRWQESVK